MNLQLLLRYTILIASSGVALIGALSILGVLVPQAVPEQFRLAAGIVVFLYGAYRFTVTLFDKSRR